MKKSEKRPNIFAALILPCVIFTIEGVILLSGIVGVYRAAIYSGLAAVCLFGLAAFIGTFAIHKWIASLVYHINNK